MIEHSDGPEVEYGWIVGGAGVATRQHSSASRVQGALASSPRTPNGTATHSPGMALAPQDAMDSPTVVEPVALSPQGCAQRVGLSPGDVIDGKYVVRERIGQGGMGSVVLADQPALGRSVAIKVLHPELIAVPDLVRRMHEEARLASQVRSPHCIEVFDCSVLPDGTPCIVMEYVPGQPLGRIIAEDAMPLARALDLFDQILTALAATHRCGIVHGDVKSDNFLIEDLGSAEHVTMIDFGLARVIGAPSDADRAPEELVVSGTPEYMAPEVIGGDPPLPASDLYGAGVILYELLTGAAPFRGGTAIEVMMQQARDPVIPPSARRPDRAIPHEIDRIVIEALSKHADARFPDAATFARELRAAAGARCNATDRSTESDERMIACAPTGAPDAPRSRRRLARGSDCSSAMRSDLEAYRLAIAGALRRGDVTAIAAGYLELANVLVERRQVARATAELQEGIDVLTAGCDQRASDSPPCVDRLVVALATLYGRRRRSEARPRPGREH